MISYDLYFDESGVFEEPSLFPDADSQTQRQDDRPSQIVGLLVPHQSLTPQKAKEILAKVFDKAGLNYKGQVHGNEISSRSRFQLIMGSLLDNLEETEFQIVRMVNAEKVGFGNNISTYTNLIAQFIIRIFEQLTELHPEEKISLSIIPARRVVPTETKGVLESIYEKDYRERFTEYLSYVAVRRGLARNKLNWVISKIKIGSARKDPELQICDLLSNASFNDFCKLEPALKDQMQKALESFNFTMFISDSFKEVESMIANGSIANAIQMIAESFCSGNSSDEERKKLNSSVKKCLVKLKSFDSAARDVQLQQIDAWLRQLLELRNNLKLVVDATRWIENFLLSSLHENEVIKQETGWFVFALHLHALTAFNHQGDLIKAREHFQKLDGLFPSLAGQWEYAPLMMEGLIHQAVHQTDCFEFKVASTKMKAVADYYGSLSELFHDALPEYFPERVRSRLRGMALGTCLQNESFAGLADAKLFDNARELSNQAIDEFSSQDDKKRQYQYRCQLETFAGNFSEAKRYLAMSLDIDSEDYGSLTNAISQLPQFPQGFALLHCSRIAAEAARQGNTAEASAFYTSFQKSTLTQSDWLKDKKEYPAHGILRAFSVIGAYVKDETFSLTILNKLLDLFNPNQQGKLFPLIILCGWSETAALFSKENPKKVPRIIERGNKNLLKEALNLSNQLNEFPEQNKITGNLHKAINDFIESGYNDWSDLIKVTRLVGY